MPENHDDAKMPPIPDGGLSDSMPDWLRRPPAWRTLKDTDDVQTEPVRSAELPEPDTSVIDPRTFLTDDDLPLWLRNMGRARRAAPDQPGDDEAIADDADDTVSNSAREPASPPAEASRLATSTTPGRFVPRTPRIVASDRPASPERTERRASSPIGVRQPSAPRWWQGPSMVLLLAGLLVVAVVVIVILAVA